MMLLQISAFFRKPTYLLLCLLHAAMLRIYGSVHFHFSLDGRLLPGCSINTTETRNMETTKIEACIATSHSCKLYYMIDRPWQLQSLFWHHTDLLARVASYTGMAKLCTQIMSYISAMNKHHFALPFTWSGCCSLMHTHPTKWRQTPFVVIA